MSNAPTTTDFKDFPKNKADRSELRLMPCFKRSLLSCTNWPFGRSYSNHAQTPESSVNLNTSKAVTKAKCSNLHRNALSFACSRCPLLPPGEGGRGAFIGNAGRMGLDRDRPKWDGITSDRTDTRPPAASVNGDGQDDPDGPEVTMIARVCRDAGVVGSRNAVPLNGSCSSGHV